MEKLSRQEINKLMERYIGTSGGYLGSFGSHPELLRFCVDRGEAKVALNGKRRQKGPSSQRA
jgi:hypothetical protein